MRPPCESCKKVCIRSKALCPHCGKRFSGPDERPCWFIEQVADGKSGRRERLSTDVPVTGLEPDYKIAMDELAKLEHRYFEERTTIIRQAQPNLKRRAIRHLELCQWSPTEIMAILGMSKSTYYRLKKGK